MLNLVDNWLSYTYFDAIDSIKSPQDVNLGNVAVRLSPLTGLDQYNESGLQPLHYAIKCKNDLAFQWLLSFHDTRVDAVTEKERWNSAHCAVKFDNPIALVKLIEARVDLNALDGDLLTPLAYLENDFNSAGWLNKLELTPLNFKIPLGIDKRSYYHYWARDSTLSLLYYLIAVNPLDINVQDATGTTALMLASELGQLETMRKLIVNDASFESVDREGRSALHRAAAAGQTSSCRLLLFDPDLIGLELEEFATELDDVSVDKAKSLAQLHVSDALGHVPYLSASLNGHVETAQVLVKAMESQGEYVNVLQIN